MTTMIATFLLPHTMTLPNRVYVIIPACNRVYFAPKIHTLPKLSLDRNGVSPLGTHSADAFWGNVSRRSKMDPRKKFFSESSVDFNGEATGTTLEA